MISVLRAGAIALGLIAPTSAVRDPGPPTAATVEGVVSDTAGHAIPGARVIVVEAHRQTTTDEEGFFRIPDLPSGTYSVTFSAIGFASTVRRITVAESTNKVNVSLRPTSIELPSIQITATPNAADPLSSPQPVSVLSGADLRVEQAPSLGETIRDLPGVHSLSTGTGIGKPVIRGLSGTRVLVLEDGTRTESQSWGDEHSPNVETANAQRIEVIRGPQSVLYGSDALGGVINVVPRELPDAIGRPGFVRANADLAYSTNNEQPDGTASIEGATGSLGFRASFTGRRSSDIRTPDGTLFNSANRAVGGSGSAIVRGGWGSLKGTVDYRDERLQIHEDPAEDPTATPYQRIGDTKARLELGLPTGNSTRLELTLGFERNRRREFEDADATDVASGLLAQTATLDAHLHHAPIGPLSGVIGVSGIGENFDVSGEEQHIIPENKTRSAGIFAFEQMDAGRWSFSFGLRYDYRNLNVSADAAPPLGTGTPAQTRSWNAVTGNVGLLYRVSEPVALVLNLGRGFRAPSAFDLFANGVHEGTVEYDIGNPDLTTEKSINTDLALRVQTSRFRAEVGAFANFVQDFIYPSPTGTTDPASGFQIYQITQGDARLTGLEASAEYHATPNLHLRTGADYTRGQNTDLDTPLPFIPPLRVTYGARLEGRRSSWFASPYLSVDGETNAKQTDLSTNDFAPAGYTLMNVGLGFSIPAAPGAVHIDITLRNALDKRYSSFMSRYKTYALNPGRNLTIRVGTEF
ncbi:MAG: TonB-dependent receptor [Gemmatimonadales bacterium]